MLQTWSCFLWSKHQSTQSKSTVHIKLIQTVHHVHKTDGQHVNPHPRKLHACLSFLLRREGRCRGFICKTLQRFFLILFTLHGLPSEEGRNLLPVGHIMRNEDIQEAGQFSNDGLLHMTHSHLQRLNHALWFIQTRTHHRALPAVRRSSEWCTWTDRWTDAMFSWIIYHLVIEVSAVYRQAERRVWHTAEQSRGATEGDITFLFPSVHLWLRFIGESWDLHQSSHDSLKVHGVQGLELYIQFNKFCTRFSCVQTNIQYLLYIWDPL